MTAALYAAIAPFASVDAGDVRFEPRTASSFALQTMGGGGSAVTALEQLRAAQGERTAFDTPAPVILTNRVLTVRVTASDSSGDRTQDATIVQITGRPQQPYIVRQHYGAPDA